MSWEDDIDLAGHTIRLSPRNMLARVDPSATRILGRPFEILGTRKLHTLTFDNDNS